MKYLWISWEIGWCGEGGGVIPTTHPFLQQASGQIFKDDVNGFLPPQIFASCMVSDQERALNREYLMYYRGPGFLAVVLFGCFPLPSPCPLSKVSLFLSLPVCRRSSLLTGENGRGRRRSQIIRRQESLVLYNPLTTFWPCSGIGKRKVKKITLFGYPLPPPSATISILNAWMLQNNFS